MSDDNQRVCFNWRVLNEINTVAKTAALFPKIFFAETKTAMIVNMEHKNGHSVDVSGVTPKTL